MSSLESEDGINVSTPVNTEQSRSVGKDLDRAGQSSGSQRSKGSARQSLDKTSRLGRGQSSSQDDPLIRELRKMKNSMKSSIETVSNRVEQLEAECGSPPAKKRARAESHCHWTDCDDTVNY